MLCGPSTIITRDRHLTTIIIWHMETLFTCKTVSLRRKPTEMRISNRRIKASIKITYKSPIMSFETTINFNEFCIKINYVINLTILEFKIKFFVSLEYIYVINLMIYFQSLRKNFLDWASYSNEFPFMNH